jgi:hypothetical protein
LGSFGVVGFGYRIQENYVMIMVYDFGEWVYQGKGERGIFFRGNGSQQLATPRNTSQHLDKGATGM